MEYYEFGWLCNIFFKYHALHLWKRPFYAETKCFRPVVTIDSIGRQLAIVEKITQKKADYVIGLKKSQKNLHKAAEEHFTAGVRVFEKESTAEYAHGRMAIREYYSWTTSE